MIERMNDCLIDRCGGMRRKLLNEANDWLHHHAEMQVRSCESVTWMSHDVRSLSSSSSELMVLSKRVAERVQTFNVRGLRSVTGDAVVTSC